MQDSDTSQLVFQRVVRVEEQVQVCVSRFLVDFSVEPSVLLKVLGTVQERQDMRIDAIYVKLEELSLNRGGDRRS